MQVFLGGCILGSWNSLKVIWMESEPRLESCCPLPLSFQPTMELNPHSIPGSGQEKRWNGMAENSEVQGGKSQNSDGSGQGAECGSGGFKTLEDPGGPWRGSLTSRSRAPEERSTDADPHCPLKGRRDKLTRVEKPFPNATKGDSEWIAGDKLSLK